ncbi:MAG: hypothetical protein ACI4B9_07170 [Eggerthellaceae bacterium]
MDCGEREKLEFAEDVALSQASGFRKGIACAVVSFALLGVGFGLITREWWQLVVFAAGLCIMIPLWDRQVKRFEYAAQEMRAVIDGKSSEISEPAMRVFAESRESPKTMYIQAVLIGIIVAACLGMGAMLACFSVTIFNPDPGMLMAGVFFILLGVVAAVPAVQWLKVAGMLKRRP